MSHSRKERAPKGGDDPGTCPLALSGRSLAVTSRRRAAPDGTHPDGRSLEEKQCHGEQLGVGGGSSCGNDPSGLTPSQVRSSYQQKLLRRMVGKRQGVGAGKQESCSWFRGVRSQDQGGGTAAPSPALSCGTF